MLLSSGGPEAVKVSFFQFFQFVYICLRISKIWSFTDWSSGHGVHPTGHCSVFENTTCDDKTSTTHFVVPFPPLIFCLFFILFFFTFHYWVTLDPFMAPAPALAKPR